MNESNPNDGKQSKSTGAWTPTEFENLKDISYFQSTFLARIYHLDQDRGCFASNSYLGQYFRLSPQRISQVIKILIDKGYLSRFLNWEGTYIKSRTLKVTDKAWGGSKETRGGSKKTRGDGGSKLGAPPLENYKGNNTVNNTSNKEASKEIEKPISKSHALNPKFKTIMEMENHYLDLIIKTPGSKIGKEVFSIYRKFTTSIKSEVKEYSSPAVWIYALDFLRKYRTKSGLYIQEYRFPTAQNWPKMIEEAMKFLHSDDYQYRVLWHPDPSKRIEYEGQKVSFEKYLIKMQENLI